MCVCVCVCVQVEHNLRKISKSSYWQYEQARLNFWQQCNALFEGEHADPPEPVDPESAAEFFEVGMAWLRTCMGSWGCSNIVLYQDPK